MSEHFNTSLAEFDPEVADLFFDCLPTLLDILTGERAPNDGRVSHVGGLLVLLRALTTGTPAIVQDAFDPAAIAAADHVVEMGPGSGEKGGTIVFQGSYAELAAGERPMLPPRQLHVLPSADLLRKRVIVDAANERLARHYGIANMLIFHKLTDLDNVGDQGSAMRALASSLLANAETRIVYRQESDQLGATATALGLTGTEQSLIPTLGTGQGLWRIKHRSFVVQHQMHPAEVQLFDTTARMTGML